MTPTEAKATDPVRVANFLAPAELDDLVARIHRALGEGRVGQIRRDPDGDIHGMASAGRPPLFF